MQECNATIPSIQPITATDGQAVHALYLHVPFCFHKCHYCDFFSLVEPKGRPDRQTAFTRALIAELEHAKAHYRLDPQTLFIGGGTPTLLRTTLWMDLLSAIRRLGILDTVREFTVEANPETVTPELAHVLAEGGVNRVSMGAQSFNPQHLKTLERWHDPDTVPRAVACLREAGINNLNLDLIFAIPGQSLDDLDRDLNHALALDPTHLSCYSLIFEPNTPLTQKMKLGRISPVGEELERIMYERVMDRLDEAGYEHYEISNWAKRVSGIASPQMDAINPPTQPDTRCLHNLAYWHNRNWLGLGPSAASHINGKRWKNEPHLGRYIDHAPTPPTCDHEHLPERQRLGEQIMLGLRLRQGLPKSWVHEHIQIDDPRHAVIRELIDLGMLEYTPTHLRLSRQGLFLADSVIAKLL
ncbi:MAG: radical SAM family heme chaperone HemW [Phycisphaeraceae bacterium]